MNSTTSQTTDSAANNNYFTIGNVVGFALTLELVQLTQPYGSLLFNGAGGFLWRINPIAAFAEAYMIFTFLGSVLVKAILPRGRKELLKNLQELSAALLLIRGAKADDSVGILMERLVAASLLDEQIAVTAGPSSITNHSTNDTGHSVSGSRVSRVDIQPVSRQPTLEANRMGIALSTLTPDAAAEKSSVLKQIFGSNALAHKDLRIVMFTAVSVLFILIKLVAVKGISCFTAAAMFSIVGWLAVQILLFFLHVREMSALDMTGAVRRARSVQESLRQSEQMWHGFYLVLHGPILGIPAYRAAFFDWFPAEPRGFVWFLSGLNWFLAKQLIPILMLKATFLGSLAAGFMTVASFFGIIGGCSVEAVGSFVLFLLGFVASVWVFIAAGSFQQQNCGETKGKYCAGRDAKTGELFQGFFANGTFLHKYVDHAWSTMYDTAWLLVLLGLMLLLYSVILQPLAWFDDLESSSAKVKYWLKRAPGIVNFLFAGVVFAIYCAKYNASTTRTFDWTQFFG